MFSCIKKRALECRSCLLLIPVAFLLEYSCWAKYSSRASRERSISTLLRRWSRCLGSLGPSLLGMAPREVAFQSPRSWISPSWPLSICRKKYEKTHSRYTCGVSWMLLPRHPFPRTITKTSHNSCETMSRSKSCRSHFVGTWKKFRSPYEHLVHHESDDSRAQ